MPSPNPTPDDLCALNWWIEGAIQCGMDEDNYEDEEWLARLDYIAGRVAQVATEVLGLEE